MGEWVQKLPGLLKEEGLGKIAFCTVLQTGKPFLTATHQRFSS